MNEMDQVLIDLLKQVDTPTVCNAIEVAQGKRGFSQFTRGTLLAADENLPAICGYARTARIKALQPPSESADVIKQRRMAYYKHMSEGPRPGICVVEDVDYPDCVGAYWGEVNTTVHKGFGLDGTLTNGVMRDLGDLAPDYQVLAGSIGPSHAFVHVVDYGKPVEVFGLQIEDGDFVHADRHGGVVVPGDVISKLGDAIEKMMASEALILEPARQDGFDFEKFEAAWSAFEKARV